MWHWLWRFEEWWIWISTSLLLGRNDTVWFLVDFKAIIVWAKYFVIFIILYSLENNLKTEFLRWGKLKKQTGGEKILTILYSISTKVHWAYSELTCTGFKWPKKKKKHKTHRPMNPKPLPHNLIIMLATSKIWPTHVSQNSFCFQSHV